MSNEESGFGATRRVPRQGVGGSPVGSWLTVALAALALVIGFFILRNLTDDDAASGTDSTEEVPVSDGTSSTTLPLPEVSAVTTAVTVAVEERIFDGAKVGVANANTVGGSAGEMSDALQTVGYEMVDPVDSDESVTASIVYFDPAVAGANAVANSVARDLGGLEVLPVETPAPTVSGDLGEADVLVLLGDNEAGKSIEDLSAAVDGAAVTPPDPAADVPSSAPSADEPATTDA